jgi:hypothetical protein
MGLYIISGSRRETFRGYDALRNLAKFSSTHINMIKVGLQYLLQASDKDLHENNITITIQVPT